MPYQPTQRERDALGRLLPSRLSVEERFWQKVDQDGPVNQALGDRCWIWTAGLKDGYGKFAVTRTSIVLAHRWLYEMENGALGALELDHHHLCPKTCVRHGHMRPATRKQNGENHAGPQQNSSSGVRGVFPLPTGRWRARVVHNGVPVHVGCFASKQEAESAVVMARNELFTRNDLDRATHE